MIRSLRLPHHKKRLTSETKNDLLRLARLLRANQGQGYFDTSHLPWFPAIWTDAMKDRTSAGWGWCCENGCYDFGIYARRDKRKIIDELEGDAVLRAAKSLGPALAHHRVPVYIDNSAFQLSFKKGWSKAARMTEVIKKLHELSVEFNCVFVPIWISTHDNIGADALSRLDLERFNEWAEDKLVNTPYRFDHSR